MNASTAALQSQTHQTYLLNQMAPFVFPALSRNSSPELMQAMQDGLQAPTHPRAIPRAASWGGGCGRTL